MAWSSDFHELPVDRACAVIRSLLPLVLLTLSAQARPREVVSLSKAQVECLLSGYPHLRDLPDSGVRDVSVSSEPHCTVEVTPRREGKGGGAEFRALPDGGYEVLLTK